MYKSFAVCDDPSRPIRSRQRGHSFQLLHRILGVDRGWCISLEHNSSYARWVENYENWSVDFGLKDVSIDGSLVIGYELSPGMMRYLSMRGVHFLSLFVHPARFLDDVLIGFYTNFNELKEGIAPNEISEIELKECALALKRDIRNKSQPLALPDSILVEQLPLDASTIVRQQFKGIQDVVDMFAPHKPLILHHPFSITRSFGGLRVDPYRILALAEGVSLYGVSSSLLYEATLFDVAAFKMHDPLVANRVESASVGILDIDGLKKLSRLLFHGKSDALLARSVVDALGFNWRRAK